MKKTTTLYHYVGLKPHHSGFGQFERQIENPSDEDLYAEIQDILGGSEFYSIDQYDDEQFKNREFEVEDISGRILVGDPDQIYFLIHQNSQREWIEYFGIDEVEVEVEVEDDQQALIV